MVTKGAILKQRFKFKVDREKGHYQAIGVVHIYYKQHSQEVKKKYMKQQGKKTKVDILKL